MLSVNRWGPEDCCLSAPLSSPCFLTEQGDYLVAEGWSLKRAELIAVPTEKLNKNNGNFVLTEKISSMRKL